VLVEPRCFTRRCKHFIGIYQPNETEEEEKVVCKAFPGGIPVAIAYGDEDHMEPIEGQKNSIVYEEED